MKIDRMYIEDALIYELIKVYIVGYWAMIMRGDVIHGPQGHATRRAKGSMAGVSVQSRLRSLGFGSERARAGQEVA